MKKFLLFVQLLTVAVIVNAQINFEGLLKDYQNGENLNGSFHSNNFTFVNYYNDSWGSWSGFAYSKMTDTLTAGFTNQYSAIAGSGYNNSQNYAVSFISSWDGADYIKLDTATTLSGFYVTNNTYAYLSMLNGDAYAKKFGGTTGDDPDWFKLTIKGYNNGTFTDSVEFYLADFRFADNSQDYIVKQWSFVDLSPLSNIDSITFALSSSDNGAYGMNTPAYFCMDNLTDLAGNVTDFEEFDFDYWNGSDLSGGFTSGEAYFFNNYNEAWGVWSGFAYSRKSDTLTAGWLNQYSAITGAGHNSETYGISYCSPSASAKLDTTYTVQSMYITNSTYAYLSMLNGDAYAKKFGGATGDDPDWFKLTIKGYNNGTFTDSVEFYLADFRFADNSQDYIIKQWTEVDLTALGNIDSLSFALSSSDNGAYGMNTPAYFCIDDITLGTATSVKEISQQLVNINAYPNPVNDVVTITNVENANVCIYNTNGQIVFNKKSNSKNLTINLSDYKSGLYIVNIKTEGFVKNVKLIKK